MRTKQEENRLMINEDEDDEPRNRRLEVMALTLALPAEEQQGAVGRLLGHEKSVCREREGN